MSYALLCPGQGGQHAGMAKHLEGLPAAESVFSAAATALGADVRRCLGGDIFENAVAQPLIAIAQLATWSAVRDELPVPLGVAGYSLGELAAYGVADALDAACLARLARARAGLMDEAARAQPGSMVALRGISRREVEALCRRFGAEISIVIAEDAFVLGASEADTAGIEAEAVAGGLQVTCLRVGVASHTSRLASAVEPLRSVLSSAALRAPRFPVVAGIDGSWVRGPERAIATLAAQVARTVEWTQCMDALHERGCRLCLELGPGAALSKLMRDRYPDVEARSVEEFGSLAGATRWLERQLQR
jgi:[acyl-carrier-protein] S-malonyltransferase